MHLQQTVASRTVVHHDLRADSQSEEIDFRLSVLRAFRAETGKDIPHKNNPDPDYASLAQWIYRIRKHHHGGQLPGALVRYLKAGGLGLERTDKKATNIAPIAEAKFDQNLTALAVCLDAEEAKTGKRNLTYRESLASESARKAYRFVEHMVLKARQDLLPDHHRAALNALLFTVNGQSIDQVLRPKPSIRALGGGPDEEETCPCQSPMALFLS